jgi:hypothetical protein
LEAILMTYRIRKIKTYLSSAIPPSTGFEVSIYNDAGPEVATKAFVLSNTQAADAAVVLETVADYFDTYTPNDFTP